MTLHRFFHQTDDSGGTGTKAGDAGKSDGKTGDGDAGEGKSKDLSPDEKFEKLSGEFDTLKADRDKIATKLGKQSEQVGILKEFQVALKNPESAQLLIAKMAKDSGLNVNFGKSAETDLATLLASDDPNDRLKAMKTVAAEEASGRDPAIVAELEKLNQGVFAAKYEDWEDQSEARAGLAMAWKAGKMSEDELLHMAVRGMSMADVVTAAEARGAENFRKELEKKNQEQIDSGGAPKTTEADAESAGRYLRTVIEAGKHTRP